MFLFRAIVVDKFCNSFINVIWLCSPGVVVPSYIEICPPYRDLVVGHSKLPPYQYDLRFEKQLKLKNQCKWAHNDPSSRRTLKPQ